MKTKLIIGLFIVLAATSFMVSNADAQKKPTETPASHMWIRTGDALVFVPLRSLQQCEMLTRQAAAINSSEADCYFNEKFLEKINCTKAVKRGEDANCKKD